MKRLAVENCPATGKRRYARKEAMRAAAWWRNRLTRMSHYHCRRCGAWHIGNNRSKPKQRGRR